jgi:hypothetical protein
LRKISEKLNRLLDNRSLRGFAGKIEKLSPQPQKIQPVVFFNASTRLEQLSLNAGFSLLTSWSFRLDGIPVIYFACRSGMSHCMLGTDIINPENPPPCAKCVSQSKTIFKKSMTNWFVYTQDEEFDSVIENLTLPELLSFVFRSIPYGELILPSLRWILRRQTLTDDTDTRIICREYLKSANNIAKSFQALLEERNPCAVVVFNGQFFPEATVRYLAMKRGIRVISHEVALQPFSAFFTEGEATAYPIHIPDNFELNDVQNRQLDSILEKRFCGNFSMAGIRFWPDMKSFPSDFWEKAESFEQIVPVFTNVIFDTSQVHANVTYPDMFAWLEDVVQLIKKYPRTFFVIRAHPDENRPGKETRESVSDWIKERKVDQLTNVIFVEPNETFNSYELIEKSKFVMVYNSTVGLEASILGAAVLCAGKARFTQVESVFFPDSREKYLAMAREFISAQSIKIPEFYKSNARKFLYFQLFLTSLPFDDFLEESEYWKGYVRLKKIQPSALLSANSETMRIIKQGILEEKPFLFQLKGAENLDLF